MSDTDGAPQSWDGGVETWKDRWVFIRDATAQDVPTIARYYVASWHSSYAGLIDQAALDAMTVEGQTERLDRYFALPDPAMTWLVADVDGRAVGHAAFAGDELYMLYVDPEQLGQGFGRALLDAATERLLAGGATTLFLNTLDVPTQPAYQLYRSAGWVPGEVAEGEVRMTRPGV